MSKTVDIAMRAKDEASRSFQSVTERLKELDSAIDTVRGKGVDLRVKDAKNLDRLTREANQLRKALESVQNQGAQTGEGLQRSLGGVNLGGVLGGLGLGNVAALATGAGIAAAAVGVGKLTVDMAQLGAQSLDTKRSFESAMNSIGQSTQLLSALDEAGGGTISQLRLMQLTNTALAGASAEMGAAFAGALPKLIEGARAANQLNPALGDTEYLFQSLVTGIKRGSPMLIDNLGITLKLGEANEAYAQKLGKSADALTEEEKKLALLNATLEGVDRLVEQAGGNLDSMTSKQQQMKVATEELKTALGEMVARPYTVIVQQVAKGVSGLTEDIRQGQNLEAAYDPGETPVARLDAIAERMAYINSLRDEWQATGNVAFDPVAAEAEASSLTRLQGALERYGASADDVLGKLDAYLAASQKLGRAQDEFNRAVAFGDQVQIDIATATLNAAQAQRDQELAAYQATESLAANTTGAMAAAEAYERLRDAAIGASAATGGVVADPTGAIARAAGAAETSRWTGYGAAWQRQLHNASPWDNVSASGRAAYALAMSSATQAEAGRRWAAEQDAIAKRAAEAYTTAGNSAAQAWESAFNAASSKIQGYLGEGMNAAKGLFDMGGGGDIFAPGANGPFENLYRALDVAKNGEGSQWAKVLGLDQASAAQISKDFQAGNFTADVQKLINIDQLTAQIQSEQAAADSSAKFADFIAARLGVDGAGDLVASKTFQAIGGALGKTDAKEQTDIAGQMIGFGKTAFANFEQGFVDAAEKTDVERVKKYGKTLYGNVEAGFLEAIDESQAFYAMLRKMVEGIVVEEL